MARQALEGVRVLDIATVIAAIVLSIAYVLLKSYLREKHIRSRMNRR